MGEAIAGVNAAGNLVTWVVPVASGADPTGGEGAWTTPLAALEDPGTVKSDCYMDFGDVSVTFTPTTRSRQRMCQKIAETIQTGETIDMTIAGVYDQQQVGATAEVNSLYDAVPGGAEVYVFRAYGWDSDADPDATTVVDVFKGTVQARRKSEPTTADEDLKFQATLSVSAYFEDVTLTAA